MASGTAISSVVPSVTVSTGQVQRVVNWIGDAWSDVQMEHDDWTWMRSSNLLGGGASFQTIAGQASYPLGTGPGTVGVNPDDFGKWDRLAFRNYTTSIGFTNENHLDEIEYDVWRNSYMLGAMRTVRTRPVAIAIGPDQSLCLGPPPNDLYTITGDYYRSPSTMVNDTDTPTGLPIQFHMIIVYRAMMKYGQYEGAQEVYARGEEENKGMYSRLQLLRAPRISWGGPLA